MTEDRLEGLIKTSHSEVELFKRCPRAHYYRYGEKITPTKMPTALLRGIAGHTALATYYQLLKEGAEFKDRKDAAQDAAADIIENEDNYEGEDFYIDLMGLLIQYFKNWRKRDEEQLEVLEIEKEFNIPVGDTFYFKIIVDAIMRLPNVGVGVWDHKFLYNFYDPSTMDSNPQLPKYLGALIADGFHLEKAFYNELRHRVTKDNKEDPSERFRLTQVDISPARISNTMRDQLRTAGAIKTLRDMSLDEWESNISRATGCDKFCSYHELCNADLNDQDTSLIKEYNFKPYGKREYNV